MSLSPKYLKRLALIAPVLCVMIFAAAPSSFAYDLEVLVGDTSGLPGTQNSVISVFMRNWTDTVAAFELWLVLSNPDILQFQTNTDTLVVLRYWACDEYDGAVCTSYVEVSDYWVCTQWSGDNCIDSTVMLGYYKCLEEESPGHCIDSIFIPGFDSTSVDTIEARIGNLDTTGTLIGGWELVESRSLAGTGYDLKISAAAEIPPVTPPFVPGIGFPQYGLKPLIKILGDIKQIPDSVEDRTVDINIQIAGGVHFNFSNQDGTSIGVVTDEVEDTLWWQCLEWVDPPYNTICYNYKRVAYGPSDSFSLDTILVGHLDTTNVIYLKSGSLTVLQGVCGDANGDNAVNLLDILFLIARVYQAGPAPNNPMLADCNCDGLAGVNINLLDILYLISYLYDIPRGPAPCCEGF